MFGKSRFYGNLILSVLTVAMAFLTGCTPGNSDNGNMGNDQTDFIIQYSDDSGTFRIEVKYGEPFSIEQIPYRKGFVFTGLFDSELGGTQYVNAKGSSLAPFTDRKNLVLFPQFRAREFTLYLDFQGAPVTGSRTYPVSYGQLLPELPKNVSLDHRVFSGWYTEPECKGVQVADAYGLLAGKSVVNERNFDLTDPDGFVYLYAGFAVQTYTVTFYFQLGMAAEELLVPYETPISRVVPDTRVDGKAVLSWSKRQNDANLEYLFDGPVTADLVLYAAEYAPVIDFDAAGGEKTTAIVAREGTQIALPQGARADYRFVGWENKDGNLVDLTEMPGVSLRLKARWQAQILFDSRGGSEAETIAEEAGSKVILPEPEREGYIFAGWYRGEEIYQTDTMPAQSVRLKAMYYEIRNEKVTVLASTSDNIVAKGYYGATGWTSTVKAKTRRITFKEIASVDWGERQSLKIRFHVKICDSYTGGFHNGTFAEAYFNFFSINNTSMAYNIGNFTYVNNVSEQKDWKQLDFEMILPIEEGEVFLEFSAKVIFSNIGGSYCGAMIGDMWGETLIPNTTKLV